MSNLSSNEVQHLAKLARLELSDEEATRYAAELSKIVDYVEQLQDVATDGLEQHGVTGLQNIYVNDVERQAGSPADIDIEFALSAAPKRSGKMIAVRAVLGGEVSAS